MSTIDPALTPFSRRAATSFGALVLGAMALPGRARAADYPTKPVRIVVAYPPGGAVDTIARKVAQKLSEQMGQQFVIENKPGANGALAATEVAEWVREQVRARALQTAP